MGLNADVGVKIRALRRERKITSTQLAEMVDVSQAQISRLELGRQGFRMVTLDKIAKALGVATASFLNGERDKAVERAMACREFRAFVSMAANSFNNGEAKLVQLPARPARPR